MDYNFNDLSDTQKVKEIRKILKDHGYSNRKVGVALKFCGYSSEIIFTVKDENVDIDLVKNLAKGVQHIYRDEWGEILSGGNTYVLIEKIDKDGRYTQIWV